MDYHCGESDACYLFIVLVFGLGFVIAHFVDFSAHPVLGVLNFLALLAISPILFIILFILAVFFLNLILRFIRIPSYLLYRYRRFWQKWTLRSRRFGWRSLRGFPDSTTPLLSEAGHSHECQTTSKLCQECFQVVEQSRLLSGCFSIFAQCTEWYKWDIPLRGSDFKASKRSCQLCNILWYSLNEQTRNHLASQSTLREQLPDPYPWLWISIWKDESGRYYLSLFDDHGSRPEHRHNLCKAIEIREELNGGSPSVHIPAWTGDCTELAKTWITDCQVTHKSHCSKGVLMDSEPYLPTRLLYVGNNISSALRLEETCSPSSALPDIKYLALSYCRSKSGLPVSQILTLDKKNEWKSQINEKELPLTFQHAIHLTRKLELNYLWIDALCIVQDCPQDHKFESESMGKVFANAHCTIASSADADGGCFHPRTTSLLDFPCSLRFSKKKAMTIRAKRHTYSSDTFSEEVDQDKLNWEALGFQERLLSRRIIHFGSRFLFFECNTHISSEVMTIGQPFREKQWSWERWKGKKFRLRSSAFHTFFNPVNGYRSSLNLLQRGSSSALSGEEDLHRHLCWFNLVSRFTRCKTMSPRDRSLAISGLAQAIQDGEEGLEYTHGLWRRHFLFDLLWFIKSGQTKKPSSERRTRSWSWQTVAGEVSQRLMSYEQLSMGKERSLMKVAELVTTKDGEDSPSEVSVEDHIMLKCPLFRCTNVFPSGNQQSIIELQTPEGRVEAIFAPDFSDFDEENLIGAEIIREVFYEDSKSKKEGKKREIASVWSNGIVLKRNYTNGQDVQVTYERVGRFWMEWPLVKDEGDPRAGNLARTILGRTKGHIIRIE